MKKKNSLKSKKSRDFVRHMGIELKFVGSFAPHEAV